MKFLNISANANTHISFEQSYEKVCFTKNNEQTIFLCRQRASEFSQSQTSIIRAFVISQNIYLSKIAIEELTRQAYAKWGATEITDIRISQSSFQEISDKGWNENFELKTIVKNLNLFEFDRAINRYELLFENETIKPLSKDKAITLAKNTRYGNSLLPEVERIFAKAPNVTKQQCTGVPLHYIIEGNNPQLYQPVLEILIGSLLQNGRLPTGHVYRFNVDEINTYRFANEEKCLDVLNSKLAEAIKGSTIVVEYGRFDDDSTFNQAVYSVFKKFVDLMAPYGINTQLIFLFPPEKNRLKQRLQHQLRLPLLEIVEDKKPKAQNSTHAEALNYLRTLARRDGLIADDTLKNLLTLRRKNKHFENLDVLYSDWRLEKLVETSLPQYQNIVHNALLEQKNQDDTKSALDKLNELIGLEDIKELIKNIILRFDMNSELERVGLPVQQPSLHLAFMGEPGTGKTEVARLYGEVLREKGILTEGRIITISGALSGSIKEAFDNAQGSVLFIDEAYGLLASPNAITQLIALMEERRHDTVVILAGYENEMNILLDSNPGFRSRLGFTLHFPNYTNEQLQNIFLLMCAHANLVLPEKTKGAVRDVFKRVGKRGDQGNARFVRKLFEDTIGAQQVRLAHETKNKKYSLRELQTILPSDVGYSPSQKPKKNARKQLEELIGLTDVKHAVTDRLDFAHVQKIKRDAELTASNLPMHMVFTGNPGTGKTEVARLVGRVLKEEGVLSVGDFYECGRQDLIGPFVGSTAPKIEALFQRAKGSVIFIDEAYSLNDGQQGGFGDEAITTIIAQMEKLRNEVVVIFAGYPQEIEQLLEKNSGFSSRISSHIEFPDYSVNELQKILKFMAKAEGVKLGSGVQEKVQGILLSAKNSQNFGNARFVRSMLEQALITQGSRLMKTQDITKTCLRDLCTLLPQDFREPTNKTPSKTQIGFRV